jgi:hypothetical protein
MLAFTHNETAIESVRVLHQAMIFTQPCITFLFILVPKWCANSWRARFS